MRLRKIDDGKELLADHVKLKQDWLLRPATFPRFSEKLICVESLWPFNRTIPHHRTSVFSFENRNCGLYWWSPLFFALV